VKGLYIRTQSVHAYLRELTTPPPALSRGRKLLLGALFVVVAISRRYALSKSPLDWDESLFACGVREYDVLAEHPHAPGYPLFILFAKLVRLVIPDDFHSLQAIASIASLLLLPATFSLLRELRFRFRVAVIGAVTTVFLPTVWYYGGTALSDVPALCAVVAASALLLAGGRNPRAWIAGMFVAGIVGGIRPVHIVIAAIPAIIGAAGLRRRRTIVAGCALFAAVVAASYVGAALATQDPPWGYLHKVAEMVNHISGTDSFQNVGRPPLRKLIPMFFVYSYRGGRAGLALLMLAAIGVAEGTIRRRVNVGIVLAMFVPTAIASWIMLDATAVTRYGLAYVLLYSVTAAHGIDVLARVSKNETAQNALTAAGAGLLVLPMINWTRPALSLARHRISPPVAAMRWIRTHVPPAGPRLYMADDLHFHAWYVLDRYDTRLFDAVKEIPAEAYVAGNYCVVDWLPLQPHVRIFSFPRTRLAQIARAVYFETCVIPMNAMIRFGEGWYQDEYDAPREHAWRWMQQSSTMLLPPIGSDGVLHLVYHVPLDALPRPPKLKLIWNGTVIDEHVCTGFDTDQRYVLASRSGAPNECRILLDETAQPKNDPRHFALQLLGISWERADGLPYGF
jgi:hypothetical protein